MAAKRKRLTDDEIYRRYRRDYKIKESRMRKRGREMDTPMLSRDDFRAVYEGMRNDMTEYAGNMGLRKPSAQQVIDTIVSDQQYEISSRQAKAYKTALEDSVDDWDDEWPGYDETGERVALTPTNIRQGKFAEPLADVFDMIRAYRERREREGASKKEIREEVSQTFFGSK